LFIPLISSSSQISGSFANFSAQLLGANLCGRYYTEVPVYKTDQFGVLVIPYTDTTNCTPGLLTTWQIALIAVLGVLAVVALVTAYILIRKRSTIKKNVSC